jgi:alanyl-tRNA synthetase
MTDRLYYTDAHLTHFSARILDLEDAGRRVYLDRSAFYPTSGGQPHDLGTLAGVPVIDVVDEGERVAHVLAEPLTEPLTEPAAGGREVDGVVDWARRFDHMQQHTGQHLLSAVFADRFGWETLSVHFGAAVSTLDLDVGDLPRAALVDAERAANELVASARPVRVAFEDAAAAARLRKPTDRAGTIRVVSIDGVDRSACGGTHVASTGAIGVVLLRRVERVRKSARVEFVCGLRAARRARADYDALADVAASFSAAVDDVPALVRSARDEARAAHAESERRRAELAALRAGALHDAASPNARGVRVVVERLAAGQGGAEALRPLALAVAERPRTVFVGTSEEPPAVLVATSPDAGVDAGGMLRTALAASGGRGGGSPRLAQGRVPSPATLDDVVTSLRRAAEGS